MATINITKERASYQAAFALDVITAAGALGLLGLASRPTFQRMSTRKFSSPSKSPLKTTLGTYLFLWPALVCLFIAYAARCVSDLLGTGGAIDYNADLSWNGRTAYSTDNSEFATSIAALTFTTTLATIFFTVLLNGGVWIHSSHVQSNGTGISTPNMRSKVWNTFIMLTMLIMGLAAWGRGIIAHDIIAKNPELSTVLSWSNILQHDRATRIIYIVHECIVVIASLSVAIEVMREYSTTNKNARESPERNDLARFSFTVVPLILLRDIFIVYDIIILYVGTTNWPSPGILASTFLLIIFRQLANLAIVAMILWGAWRMGRTVNVFRDSA